jgi:hypothetical protein
MIIEIKDKIDFKNYEDFITHIPRSTFTSSSNHIKLLEKILNLEPKYVIVEKDNEIKGIMPFFEKKNDLGLVINSLPFFGSHGGLISNDYEIDKMLISKFNEYANENDVLSSVVISNPFVKNNTIYENYLNHNHVEKRFTQCTVLENENSESMWKKFEKRTRWTIRKCEKNLIHVYKSPITSELSSNFYEIYKIGMKIKKGRLKPSNFFEHVKNNFIFDKDYAVFVAEKNSLPIAYLLVFYHYPFAEYYMPAFDKNYSNYNATSMLIWKSIEDSLSKKLKFYNFGGTLIDQHSLYLFKRNWGSSDFYYNYYINANLERIKSVELDNLKSMYENFYVFSFSQL